MRKALLVVALGLVMLLTVVSCSSSGGSSGGSSGAQSVSTTASEMKYDPNTWTAKAGQPVTVNVKNGGTVTHDWIVKGMEDQTKIEVQAGQSGSKTFTITSPGTYNVYCSQPGHEAAGMKGTLTVQ
jgi:uncharacterized cupredoxin-like copper-binding protein